MIAPRNWRDLVVARDVLQLMGALLNAGDLERPVVMPDVEGQEDVA